MTDRDLNTVEIRPIGFVSRLSSGEDERDRSLIARIVVDASLEPALHGIEEWSHLYVIGCGTEFCVKRVGVW